MTVCRLIYNQLWNNEYFLELDHWQRELYIRLIVLSDDHGKTKINEKILKRDLFFNDTDINENDITNTLHILNENGLIKLYCVNNEFYCLHPNFKKFQKMRSDRIKKSVYPDYTKDNSIDKLSCFKDDNLSSVKDDSFVGQVDNHKSVGLARNLIQSNLIESKKYRGENQRFSSQSSQKIEKISEEKNVNEHEKDLKKQMENLYKKYFFESFNTEAKFESGQKKALNQIIEHLEKINSCDLETFEKVLIKASTDHFWHDKYNIHKINKFIDSFLAEPKELEKEWL